MAARKEDILNSFWDDLDEALSNEAMLLYIWSWTNRRVGASGFYSVARRQLLEGRFDAEVLDAALKECEDTGKLMYRDGVMWSITRAKRLGWKNPNAAELIRRELADLDPANPIYAAFIDRYEGHPWGKTKDGEQRYLTLREGSGEGFETPPKGSGNGSEAHDVPQNEADAATPPEGSGDPSGGVPGSGSGSGNGSGSGEGSLAAVRLAETAPAAIRKALPAVEGILGRISETRGLAFAERDRIAAAMVSYSDVDHVAAAEDFEDWACRGTGKSAALTDVVQSYRSQLEVRQRKAEGAKRPDDGGKPSAELAEYDRAMESAA